jgi:hypothetical protein
MSGNPVDVSVQIPHDDDLAQGSIDELVRNVLWAVAHGGSEWDRGYALFLQQFLTSTSDADLMTRLTDALDYVIMELLAGHDDAEERAVRAIEVRGPLLNRLCGDAPRVATAWPQQPAATRPATGAQPSTRRVLPARGRGDRGRSGDK